MAAKTQSIGDLRRELQALRKRLAELRSRRAKVAKGLAAIDKEIAALTGERAVRRGPQKAKRKAGPGRKKKAVRAPKAGRRKRATGKPLAQYIGEVLGKAPKGMRVNAVMTAVVKAGYKSGSKDFYAIVAKTLLQGDQFQRVTRGVYKLKG